MRGRLKPLWIFCTIRRVGAIESSVGCMGRPRREQEIGEMRFETQNERGRERENLEYKEASELGVK